MRLDQNPVFRKVIVPWYDSEIVCLAVIVVMGLVTLFGIAGMSVAREIDEFQGYGWVPTLLVVLSAAVIISTTIRLIKRYTQRFSR